MIKPRYVISVEEKGRPSYGIPSDFYRAYTGDSFSKQIEKPNGYSFFGNSGFTCTLNQMGAMHQIMPNEWWNEA